MILTLASVLLNSLWQGVLIAAVVQVAARMLPDGLAAYRYALRWLGLVLVAVVALMPVMRESPVRASHGTAAAVLPVRTYLVPAQPVAVSMKTSSTTPVWPLAALLVICCSGMLLGRLVLSYVALEGTKRRAKRVDAGVPAESARRKFTLAESNEVETPVLAGLWRPAVLLPDGFIERYPAAEVRAAILHEQAHLARWDDWTQLAQRLVDAVLFFHPGVRGLTWGMELDRELACDVAVLARTGDPRSYCQCLARLVGVAEPSAAPMPLTGRGRTIFKRMETIMNLREIHGRGRALVTLAAVAVIGAMLAAIGPMVVLQGTAPSLLAQEKPAPAKPRAVAPAARPASPSKTAKSSLNAVAAEASATSAAIETAMPNLNEAIRDLNRDIAAIDEAIRAATLETHAVLHSLQPALTAVNEAVRRLDSEIAVQSLGVLTADQYRAAETEYAETMRRYEEERRRDPEATRQRDIAQIERVGMDLRVPRSAIDAAIKAYLEDGKPSGNALGILFRNATQF